MALSSDLESDLRRALRSFKAANGAAAIPTAAGRALEAWLAMSLARAADDSGEWFVSLRRGDGSRLPIGGTFAFPTSQAGILPPNPNGPGHVLLVWKRNPRIRLEMHGSLQWIGRSGSTHECDVSVLPSRIAAELRRSGGGWPRGLPVAAYECKDRPGTASPDEMRQTVARLYDLALVTRPLHGLNCRIYEPSGPTEWGRRRTTYRSYFASGDFGVVRVGRFGPGASSLAKYYHVATHAGIYDASADVARIERRFVTTIGRCDVM